MKFAVMLTVATTGAAVAAPLTAQSSPPLAEGTAAPNFNTEVICRRVDSSSRSRSRGRNICKTRAQWQEIALQEEQTIEDYVVRHQFQCYNPLIGGCPSQPTGR